MAIPESLRRFVIKRAEGCCEYCQLAQAGQEAKFHIDHIVQSSAGGASESGNLALACVSCSLRKGARQFIKLPGSDRKVAVFNPRLQTWADHFAWDGLILRGTSEIGVALVEALQMNRPVIVAIRQEEVFRGRHPKQMNA